MKNQNLILLNRINSLPDELKAETLDFIDFLVQKYKKNHQKANLKAGFLKNTFTMANDFDAPLDDFMDYM